MTLSKDFLRKLGVNVEGVPKYSNVRSAEDIRKINRKIRKLIKYADNRAELTQLYKQSMYLVTLTYSPAWRKHFKGKPPRKTAKEEFHKTAVAINKRARELGLPANYDTVWGDGR